MAARRKTIDLDVFVNWCNDRLAKSNFQDRDSTEGVGYRKGIMTAVEEALFTANRYQGYRAIRPSEAEVKDGWGYDDATGEWNDDTRRHYFI